MKLLIVLLILFALTDTFNLSYIFPKWYYRKKIKNLQEKLKAVDESHERKKIKNLQEKFEEVDKNNQNNSFYLN